MAGIRSFWSVGVLMLVASVASAGPERHPPAYQAAVETYLAGAMTKTAIEDRLQNLPVRCQASSSTHELCEWRLRDVSRGWEELASAIQTRDRVALICEFRTRDEQRAKDGCDARPRRSNRSMFVPPGRGPGRNGKGMRLSNPARSREASQKIARGWLEEARTLVEMSRLLGAVPEHCEVVSETEQACVWRAAARTYGHGTIAASLKASGTKKVRLARRFPRDGGERDAASCRGEIDE